MSKPPRVLILTASVGAGHTSAAHALGRAVGVLRPDAVVEVVDALEHASAPFRKVYRDAYLDLVNRAPNVLGWFYEYTDRAPSATRTSDRLRLLVQRMQTASLGDVLYDGTALGRLRTRVKTAAKRSVRGSSEGAADLPPAGATPRWDAVINTHFLPAEILARLRRKGRWPDGSGGEGGAPRVPVYTVVTDFDAHGMWATEPIDGYFVATLEAELSLARWGVDPRKVRITGIPINPAFAEERSRAECRRAHGLSDDRPVVLLLAGGFGVGPIEDLFDRALEVCTPIHLHVVCGKNEALRERLEKAWASGKPASKRPAPGGACADGASRGRHRVTVTGFTKQMDELMGAADVVVSKPGGLTTSEILARGCAMAIVNPIPGQESRNSDYLLENGAAVKINSPAVLPHKLDRLLSDPARLRGLRESAGALGRPRAAFDVAGAVLEAVERGRDDSGDGAAGAPASPRPRRLAKA
jgi:processive 1,2-diacylglycerol beta-glucosyltransferase